MTKKLTLRKTVELHRELWRWLAENPASTKDDWPRWAEIEAEYGGIRNHCFACEYCKADCFSCPFDWTFGSDYYSIACITFNGNRPGLYSLYSEFWKADGYDTIAKTKVCAKQIALLPLKWRYKLMYLFMPWK